MLVTDDTLEEMASAISSAPPGTLVGFDTEQGDLNVEQTRDKTISIQFAYDQDYLLPIRFKDFANLDLEHARQQLARVWDAVSAGRIVLAGANIAFDLDATHCWHGRYFESIEDCIIKAWVADPGGTACGRKFGLKDQAFARLGLEMLEFDEVAHFETIKVTHPLTGKVKNWPRPHFERNDPRDPVTQRYALEDARCARRLCEEIQLQPGDQLIYEAELLVSELIRRYRCRGHHVDLPRTLALFEQRRAVIQQSLELLRELADQDVNTTPREISELLAVPFARHQRGKQRERVVQELLPSGRKRAVKGPDGSSIKEQYIQYSTSKAALECCIEDRESTPKEVEIARAVLAKRSPEHDISTYIQGLLAVGDDCRLRFDVRQTGQITARFSGAGGNRRQPWSVNVLTIPRDPAMRQCFGAPPDMWFASLDFASQEPRTLANLSRDTRLVKMFQQGLDFHARTASVLFGCAVADVTKAQRKIAKPEGLATLYGQSAFTLASNHDETLEWAHACIHQIEGLYPEAIAWRHRQIARSLFAGGIVTAYGRRIPRDRYEQGLLQSGHKDAPNATIQGSCADMLRIAIATALAWLDEQAPGSHLVATIHDSLDLHVRAEHIRLMPELCRAIERAVQQPEWPLPMLIDCKVGHSWGQLYAFGENTRDTFPGDIQHSDETLQAGKVSCHNLEQLWR